MGDSDSPISLFPVTQSVSPGEPTNSRSETTRREVDGGPGPGWIGASVFVCGASVTGAVFGGEGAVKRERRREVRGAANRSG